MRNKQKIVYISILLIMMVSFSGSKLFGASPNVYDNAALFTASELEALDNKAAGFSEKLMLDFIILTISDNKGKTTEDYAQDFYSQNKLGYGAGKYAILIVFDMDSEQLYVSPFSNDGTDYSNQVFKFKYDEMIAKYGSDDFYYKAAITYLDTIESYINDRDMQIISDTISEKDTGVRKNISMYIFAAVILGSMVVLLAVPKMDNTYMNDMSTGLEMGNYLQNNALNIIEKQDRHINTQMAVRK